MFMIPLPVQQNRARVTYLGGEPEGNRAVIRQADLHVGTELARFDRGEPLSAGSYERIEIR